MSDMTKLDDEVRVIAQFGDVSDGTSYVEHGMAREIMRLRDERQRLLTENAALRAEAERLRALATSDWNIAKAHAKERERLTAAVWRVRALHSEEPVHVDWCNECDVAMPCPTLRALEGAP